MEKRPRQEVKAGEDPTVVEKKDCRPLLDGGQGKDTVVLPDIGKNGVAQEERAKKERLESRRRSRRRRPRLRQRQARKKRLTEGVGEASDDDSDAGMPPLAHREESSSDEESAAGSEDDGEAEGCQDEAEWPGLRPPRMHTGDEIDGSNKRHLRRQNKQTRQQKQVQQEESTYWATHKGKFEVPPEIESQEEWRGEMCPKGLALHHPAAGKLLQYAIKGCPSRTGRPWTKQEMQEAIDRGPHISALVPEAMEQLHAEIAVKVANGQCQVVYWDEIKDNPPEQLKISPLAMVPHKSKPYRGILDLSWALKLANGGILQSVNDSTTLSAPAGAIDQMGHSLERIIHAFAEAGEDDKVFMAKYDIKDGFWRMQCEAGEEWNFCYVLPQAEGMPVALVVPASLQMGWVESPPYFCAASETARDVAADYVETPIGSLPDHKFQDMAMGSEAVKQLPIEGSGELRYMVEVYVDDFISIAIATSQEQLEHVAQAVMKGIHDVFPPDDVKENDPISYKKLKKEEGRWDLNKEILGFDFDGEEKTMILGESKLQFLLTTLHKWIRTAKNSKAGIPFAEFESVIAKLRHAFRAIPAGRGLLSVTNKVIIKRPSMVFLQRNKPLMVCLDDCRRMLREAAKAPTPCRELVMGEPDYVGVKDASIHGVGGVIIGEKKECVPTVFRVEWPQDIKNEVLKTNSGRKGNLTNSDLECAGLVFLFLVMEVVCDLKPGDHIALFSDNSPTVSWVRRMAARGSLVADQLLRILAFRLKARRVSPLTPLHIEGKKNEMTDVPSRSFGSNPAWFCRNDAELLTMFNKKFLLPQQRSWMVFQITSDISTRVISLLRMQLFTMDEFRRLPTIGQHVGGTGVPMSGLWEWTLTYRRNLSQNELEPSQDSQLASEMEDMVRAERLRVIQYRRLYRPLDRRSTWCAV